MVNIDNTQIFATSLCPVCNNLSIVIDSVRTINPECDETVNLRNCSSCKHWWIDPIPTQNYLSRLYSESSLFVINKGFGEDSKESKTETNRVIKYSKKILKLSTKQNNFNFLEVGVGSGHIFNYFTSRAKLCYGVEPGSWKPLHTNIVVDIKDIPENIKFDIIVMHDVLEHLSNPLEMLTRLHNMANAECLISLGFPNSDSLSALLFRGKWRMVRPLGHIHFFSSKSTLKLLDKCGWNIILMQKCRPLHLSTFDLLKQFNFKNFRNPLRGIYRLLWMFVMDIVLGKDQWFIQAKKK